jgi:mannosyltransferase
VKTPDVDVSFGVGRSIGDESSPARQAPETSTPLQLSLLALITGVAGALRFHSLSAKSFWFDEGVGVAIARLDWYNFVRILWRREANMSLYYLFLRAWLHFGGSEFWVRTLSVLFAVLSIPVIYSLGKRLFDTRTALLAATLLAINAYHIQYSQEARSYPLMVLLCMISSLYFLKCLADPSRSNRLIYILSSGLAVYAHFYSVLLVLTQWLSLSFLDRQQVPRQIKSDWRWIALSISPVVAFLAATGAGPLRWVQRPGWKELWGFALDFVGHGGPLLLLAYAAAVVVALLPVWRTRRVRRISWDEWKYRLLAMWLVFPALLVLLLSFIKPLFVLRYFISSQPALFLLAACGLSRLRRPAMMAPAILILLVLSVRGTVSGYQRDIDIQRDNWRNTTQYLLEHAQPGDALMFHVPMGRMPYEFYLSLSAPVAAPVVLYPHHVDRITFLDFVEKPDYPQLERLLPQHPRVWLVLNHAQTAAGIPDTRSLELSQMLGKFYPAVQPSTFPGMDIFLYSREENHSP